MEHMEKCHGRDRAEKAERVLKMNELKQFDLGKIVRNLNSKVNPFGKRIELGDFVPGRKGKNQSIKGRYDIFLVDNVEDYPGSMRLSFIHSDDREKVGRLDFVGEDLRYDEHFKDPYSEKVVLRFDRSVDLANGVAIPKCIVEINRKMTKDPDVRDVCRPLVRRDYTPGFLWKRKANFKDVLPTIWFE